MADRVFVWDHWNDCPAEILLYMDDGFYVLKICKKHDLRIDDDRVVSEAYEQCATITLSDDDYEKLLKLLGVNP
ncbi:MAG: hypothetical protein GXO43_09840 [Crenarchaeota archaeon]|nr:hypothetical protein [Thermoproteota archaeon]